MKKPLLFGMSLAIGITMSAQGKMKLPGNAPIKKAKTFVTSKINDNVSFPAKNYAPKAGNHAKVTAPPYKRIGTSANVLTALVSQSNPLNYNKDLNAVSFVHRQSGPWTGGTNNSGNHQITFSTNNGTTWDSVIFGLSNGSSIRYRYPSGAIYNPSGNTNIDSAFAVGAGPITDGGSWVGNGYTSGQLDGSNLDSQDLLNGAGPWPTHHFARIDFDVAGGIAKVSSGLVNDINGTTVAAYGYRGAAIASGTFNATSKSFDWTFDTINIQAVAQVDGVGDAYMSTQGGYMAWSDNGQTGYVMFVGVDVAATTPGSRSYQPIVYKTTNGGTSWTQYMPGFNWGQIQLFQDSLISYDGVNVKPFFTQQHGNDMAVDKNGDLHIAIQVMSGASDHQDSLGYIFNATNYIFDCWTTPTGWNAELIDIIQADPSADEATVPWSDQTASPPAPYNVDARLQISKSVNGDKLFFVWAENDVSGLQFPILEQPEIRVKGVDVDSRCWTATKPYIASGDFAFWHYASQDAMSPTATSYIVPVTYINSADGSNNAIAQVDHYYMDDISFVNADFSICPVGMSENNGVLNGVSVYPNPTSGNATLSVKMTEASEIIVTVYNNMGQVVSSQKVKCAAGVNQITLGTAELSSGLYFYEVKAGGNVATSKLMIGK